LDQRADRQAELRSSSLSGPRQRLLESFRRLEFGRIEHLRVVAGEPVIDQTTRVIREVSLGKGLSPQTRTGGDFLLKREVVDLLDCLDRLGDGIVLRLHIRHGVPIRVEIEDRFDVHEMGDRS